MDSATFPIIVHTLIFDEGGRLLLLRRKGTGFMDGYLGLPGGHLQAGETVTNAAMRECKEEVCIEAKALQPLVVMPFMGGVDFIFEAHEWNGMAEIGNPTSVQKLAGLSRRRYREMLSRLCLKHSSYEGKRSGITNILTKGMCALAFEQG